MFTDEEMLVIHVCVKHTQKELRTKLEKYGGSEEEYVLLSNIEDLCVRLEIPDV